MYEVNIEDQVSFATVSVIIRYRLELAAPWDEPVVHFASNPAGKDLIRCEGLEGEATVPLEPGVRKIWCSLDERVANCNVKVIGYAEHL